MKNYIYLLIIMLCILFTGCEKVIEKKPLNIISEKDLLIDDNIVDAYLNNVYKETKFLNRSGQSNFNMFMVSAMGAEGQVFGAWQDPYNASVKNIDENGEHKNLKYWPYKNIRAANELILALTDSDIEQEVVDKKVSELRFLRAYMYFEMVKRYGGVPLILVPQDPTASEEELFVTRNSEKEIYDFIATEMDDIAEILPATYDASGYGRPTKWAALALKSRAMLYAASIAQFGQQQLDGLLGFPSGETQSYWQKCYDASKEIIDESEHELYNELPGDPAENYRFLFLEEDPGTNKEPIFVERFDGENVGHDWSHLALPAEFASNWGNNFWSFLEFIELYEYADGTPGAIDRDKLNDSTLWDVDSIFGNRDHRFEATFFYPESEWQGINLYIHSETRYYDSSQSMVVTANSGTIGADWPASGLQRNTAKTGIMLKKRLDENDKLMAAASEDDTDYIVFRLGEMYLNLAEAAFYLGLTGESLDAINEIRGRAGAVLKGSVTEDIIRNERQVELAFEDHRYWDLRRWRIAESVLNGARLTGLKYTYDYDEDKYIITTHNAENTERTFQERHYYFPINIDRIGDNPNLIENPGYSSGN